MPTRKHKENVKESFPRSIGRISCLSLGRSILKKLQFDKLCHGPDQSGSFEVLVDWERVAMAADSVAFSLDVSIVQCQFEKNCATFIYQN